MFVRASVVTLVALLGVVPVEAQKPSPFDLIQNWQAPPFWMPVKPSSADKDADKEAVSGLAPEAVTAVPTSALAFTGIAPCRVADTRGNGFSGQYGPPQIFTAGRTMTIVNVCGIPATAQAVSFNFSAVNIPGAGFLVAFPAGGAFPPTATMVYNQNTPNLSNSAVVPLGTGGAITLVGGVVPIDLVIDVNGYYAPNVVTSINGSTGAVTIPVLPSGSSGQTLRHNGTDWVANSALTSDGTSIGLAGPLRSPSQILGYTYNTLLSLRIEGLKTFIGQNAGNTTTSGGNLVGIGQQALGAVTSGIGSVAVGDFALAFNQAGAYNTAVGMDALISNIGSSNIALGRQAGVNLQSGSFNMYLGNEGVNNEFATIRIGSGTIHSRLFLAGVLGANIGSGNLLYINGSGQVGTVLSSARYKDSIRDMADASDALLKLRPVTFHYKDHPDDPMQFGLIAEEVEKVLPELVTHNSAGEPETVMYHELPPMLLNEIQKQEKEIRELRALVEELSARSGECSSTP